VAAAVLRLGRKPEAQAIGALRCSVQAAARSRGHAGESRPGHVTVRRPVAAASHESESNLEPSRLRHSFNLKFRDPGHDAAGVARLAWAAPTRELAPSRH
jgi:hypothetical protein